MKGSGSFLVLFLTLVLITVALVLVSFWGYKMYFYQESAGKNARSDTLTAVRVRDTVYMPQNSRNFLSDTLSTDSTQSLLLQKLDELNRLQEEIQALMQQQSDTVHTINLQNKIHELKRNLDQLLRKKEKTIPNDTTSYRNDSLASQRKALKGRKNPNSGNEKLPVTINQLRMMVYNKSYAGYREKETKMIRVYFSIGNSSVPKGVIYVVVTRPDGSVLPNAQIGREAVFLLSEGQQAYTAKLFFNPSCHHLSFSMETTGIRPGTYTVQVYYNGMVLGSLRKTMG